MRNSFLILSLLAAVSSVSAQVTPSQSIRLVTTAPSGSCVAGLPNQQVLSTGTQYSCQSVVSGVGTWGTLGVTTASPIPGTTPGAIMATTGSGALQASAATADAAGNITTSGTLAAGTVTALSVNGVVNAALESGSDIGAQVNTAVASSACTHGCRIQIPAGTYSYSTGIVLNQPDVSLECPRGTTLTYTGTSDAVLIEEGDATPYLAGSLSGCQFDGTGNTNPNVHGIRLVDTDGFAIQGGAAFSNFTASGDVGMDWQNEPATYCPLCGSTFSERTYVGQVSVLNNTVGWELDTSPAGAGVSFEYSNVRGLHLQVNDGQTGILAVGQGTTNSLNLQHSFLWIAANILDPTTAATFIQLENGASIYQNDGGINAEETSGTHAVPYNVDASSSLDLVNMVVNATLGGASVIAPGAFTYFPPNTIPGNDSSAFPSPSVAGSEYNPVWSFGGNTAGSMPGDESIAITGASSAGGQINPSILFGNFSAGVGFDYGTNIQHPLSWCYTNDPDCYDWFTINSSYAMTKVASMSNGGVLGLNGLNINGVSAGVMPGSNTMVLGGTSGLNAAIEMGDYAAGIGFDLGSNIQHPIAWCYVNDPTCFAWYTVNSSYGMTQIASMDNAGHLTLGTGITVGSSGQFSVDASGNVSAPSVTISGSLKAASVQAGVLYSAAGTALPTCAAGIQGEQAVVSDATAPTYMGAYTSGGAITTAVICSYNGTTYSWLTH